ncbi:MAG: iron-sulfur cluster assembly protein [Chryseolinea sp.]
MDDAASTPAPGSALSQQELDKLTDQLVDKLKTVFDPEIPVDIYELGLIYKVDVSDDRDVAIDMTLTAPGCPVAGDMPGWVKDAVMTFPPCAPARSIWCSIRRGTVADVRRGQAATEHVLTDGSRRPPRRARVRP